MCDELISVIIPCYNDGPYLADAIESVLKQGYSQIEIIVVDDGSSDNSEAVAKSYGDQVTYIHQDNQGISAARNTGLKHCKGNYIGFLDADDMWSAGGLSVRLKTLKSHPTAECIYGSVKQFISPDVAETIGKKFICPPDARQGRLAGALILTREAFERIGFFDEELRVGETMDWVARGEQAGVVFFWVKETVLNRRINEHNTLTKDKQDRSDYLRALKASLDRQRQSNQRSPKIADR